MNRVIRRAILPLVALSLAALTASCDDASGPTGPNPAKPTEIVCAPPGIGDAHPKSGSFQAVLDKYSGREFPGIALAIASRDGVWVGASGLADRERNVAMSPCHAFFSGSVAKTYTATAAMRLVEDGALGLDDRIADYLPEEVALNVPNASSATVRQLMNHSAGMPDHDDDAELEAYVESHNGSLPSAVEQLAYLYDDPARFAPGTTAQYSSAHTLALSLVVDQASGSHHSDVVSRDIIQRLGLANTWYKNEAGYPRPMHLVRGYLTEDDEAPRDFTDEAVNYAATSFGDAGFIATVHDYHLFLRGLIEGRVVGPSAVATMRDPFMLFEDGEHGLGFGLGLFVIKRSGQIAKIGHSGSTLGGMTHLYYYPEADAYIALATNVITGNADQLLRWGASLLLDSGDESIMDDLEQLIR